MMPLSQPATPIKTGIPQVPVTIKRTPYNPTAEQNARLPNPGTAHANISATLDAPLGTQTDDWAARHAHRTVLQQHVDFFDTNGDGLITPFETYRSFRALGFGIVLSILFPLLIHLGLSYATVDGILPDPLLRINTNNIHMAKHGSDSGTYDNEGRFIPQKFEDFFSKYSSVPGKDGLTKGDIWRGLKGQRLLGDSGGSVAAISEWGVLWLMVSPKDGILKKEDVRRLYDGSLFAETKAEHLRAQMQKRE
ncbi:calcium binding protein Caleosin [Fomes fomentarius]|nr:calcium binding protein Caleosin [Fomes fomentarius]